MASCPRKAAGDAADDVHHVAVALNDHQIGHLHAAVLAHTTDVVAGQIHEHDVFGAFFRISEQILFVRHIFFRRFAAWSRAGNGADLHLPFLAAHMDFRRSAYERKTIEPRNMYGEGLMERTAR